ncbi:MAG: hypothetical protein IANPNBLG_00665 [Bryobacteraceae bacterium]|nr:hypothetical protein [Bryobacteraceae bacterium]
MVAGGGLTPEPEGKIRSRSRGAELLVEGRNLGGIDKLHSRVIEQAGSEKETGERFGIRNHGALQTLLGVFRLQPRGAQFPQAVANTPQGARLEGIVPETEHILRPQGGGHGLLRLIERPQGRGDGRSHGFIIKQIRVVEEEVTPVHGVCLPGRCRAIGYSRFGHAVKDLRVIGPVCVDNPERAELAAVPQKTIDVGKGEAEVGNDGVPAPDAGGDGLRNARFVKGLEHSRVVLLFVIVPGHGHRALGQIGGQFRVPVEQRRSAGDIRPEEDAPAVAPHEFRHVAQVAEIEFAGFDAARRGAASALEFPGFVEPDVEPRTGEERGHLSNPILKYSGHFGIRGIQVPSVGQRGKIGVPLDPEQVVQVAVEFKAGHNVHMALAGIRDDSLNLFPRIAAAGIDERVPLQLDGEFGVEVILVALPARQEIDLAFDFVLGGEGAVTEIEHHAAIGERRPVLDLNNGQRGGLSAAFDQLENSLDGVEEAG